MINDENKRSFKRMLKSNGLYFAIALCLLAAGSIGYSSVNKNTPSTAQDSITLPTAQNPAAKVNEKENDYKVEIRIDEFTEAATDEPSTAAVFENSAPEVTSQEEPVIFYSPVSLSIGADYSMGIPVFSETMNDYRTHNGVDFKGVKGESVKTTGKGTVVSVTKDALWGNTVTIDHGNGITSSISGLADEMLISVGSVLEERTIIGVVGDIPVESEEDAHVHLEMRANGELVDPIEILGLVGEE